MSNNDLDRKELYKKIKKELLNDENISIVSYNSSNKSFKITPKGEFLCVDDVFTNFMLDNPNLFLICGVYFKISRWEHFNTNIYLVILKEVIEEK